MGIDTVLSGRHWAAVPFHFWSGVFFVLGSVVGSFLNVVIHRLPRGESVVSPPSHCPHCNYAIPWYLNVPLLTWLWLRGRCRNCGVAISARYFVVELATGLLFLSAWLKFGPLSTALAIVFAVFLAWLLTAAAIDQEHMIVPDEIAFGGIGAGLLASLLVPVLQGIPSAWPALGRSVLGAGVGAAMVYAVVRGGKLVFGRQTVKLAPGARVVFTEEELVLPDGTVPYGELFYRATDAVTVDAQHVEMIDRGYARATICLTPNALKVGDDTFRPETVPHLEATAGKVSLPREAMGFGDVELMAAVGAFLGWQATVFSLFGSALIGTVVAGVPYLLRGCKGSPQVAFIPYIAAAAAIWVFWRDPIMRGIKWWLFRT